MTGRRFHCTIVMITALPWKSKNPTVSPPLTEVQNKEKQGVQPTYVTELPPFISIVRHLVVLILGRDFEIISYLAGYFYFLQGSF